MQTAAVNAPSQARVSFRAATMERIDVLAAENLTLSASLQPIQRTVEGAGYIYGILLVAAATGATQTAASVAVYTEDAPFNIYDTVSLADANGELWNLSGFESACVNQWTREDADPAILSTADGAALPS